LVVGVSREGLGLLGRNGRVSWNQNSHHSTCSLDTLGERSNVKQQ
jgi:hypothetical protein